MYLILSVLKNLTKKCTDFCILSIPNIVKIKAINPGQPVHHHAASECTLYLYNVGLGEELSSSEVYLIL